MSEFPLTRIDDQLWEIPVGARPRMRVPARVFADQELLAAIERDHSLEQLANAPAPRGRKRDPKPIDQVLGDIVALTNAGARAVLEPNRMAGLEL